ncbi:MAG TPA: peptidoglycan-binding domain-containing protein [Chthoniobacterales bacterium]|nr:peptidoglycan-binding domain-containing protein [Chthoniobacterales bacterium]
MDQEGYDDQSGYQQRYQNGYANQQSANSTVAAVQDRLVRDGFYSGQIDGVLGPETRHALVRFQTKRGLRISGELTTETLDALGLRQYGNYGSN